jgi:hypothetical protein
MHVKEVAARRAEKAHIKQLEELPKTINIILLELFNPISDPEALWKEMRVEYDHRHMPETMNSFWQYIHFTDEAHFDPDEVFAKRVLREEDTRYEAANMQAMSQMKAVKLHFEASIFYIIRAHCCFTMTSIIQHLLSSKSHSTHADQDIRRKRRINNVY